MESTNASQPSKSSDAESTTAWTLSVIQMLAEADFPDQFHALPAVQMLTFRLLSFDDKNGGRPARLKEYTAMMLAVGHYDHYSFSETESPPVFAFISGDQNHHIGYAYQPTNSTKVFYLSQERVRSVSFEKPFCDIDAHNARAIFARLRAVILYYFLAAGHIQQTSRSNHFLNDFQQACNEIAESSAMSDPNIFPATQEPKQPAPDGEAESIVTSGMPCSDPQAKEGAQHDSASRKRKREDGKDDKTRTSTHSHNAHGPLCASLSPENASPPAVTAKTNNRPRKSPVDLEHGSSLQESELEATQYKIRIDNQAHENARLSAQCTTLTAKQKELKAQGNELAIEVERLRRLRDYDANAYKGLEQKYNDMKSELRAAKQLVNGLRKDVEVSRNGERRREAEAAILKRDKNAAEAALHQLRAAVAGEMATVASHANALARKYGIDLTRES